jgi:hypothetical protein
LDEGDHALRLARRKFNHDLADLPVPGNKAESCRDRFGHAMLCGPIGPDAIESDSVRIGVALRGAFAPNPANLREGVKRRMCSMAGYFAHRCEASVQGRE